MTVDDISRDHMRRVRVGVSKKIGKAHGWKREVIVERAFVKFNHDLDIDLRSKGLSWHGKLMKLFKSTRRVIETALVRGSGVRKRRSDSRFKYCCPQFSPFLNIFILI